MEVFKNCKFPKNENVGSTLLSKDDGDKQRIVRTSSQLHV